MEKTSNLSAEALPRSALFFNGHNEQTESQAHIAKARGNDPESTEEIIAAGIAAAKRRSEKSRNLPEEELPKKNERVVAGVARRETQVEHRILPEVTHPITLAAGAAAGPASQRYTGHRTTITRAAPVEVRIAEQDADSTELVELLIDPATPRTSVAPGETLSGRYLVLEEVNHRGMGLVYKALDRKREKAGLPVPCVALKFAALNRDGGADTASNLREEFLKLSQLNHPNIVSVFDFDNDGGLDFIVMEWLEGETLADVLADLTSKRIALHKAEEIIDKVGDALAHAHAHGIVHGDVKPSNILLTHSRTVKLLDFGSSVQTGTGNAEANWATRAYASCEVLEGAPPQPQDDVYALGVTAYCLLSGERPFGTLDALEARQQSAEPPPLPPDALERWAAVLHALRFEKAQRPANAGEFLAEFLEPPAKSSLVHQRPQLEHIAYGAIAVALLIALVAWTVGPVGGLPSEADLALASAETALAEGRLMEPREESALGYFSSVLETSPDNARALAGLDTIAEHYLDLTRQAISADEVAAAVSYLGMARQARPQHYGIGITEDLLARHGKELLLRARQSAATDMSRAERLVAEAETLLPSGDPSVMDVRADLAELRLDQQLQALLQQVDERILSERLILPRGDSAVDLLQKARGLAADDRQVNLAADRVATALLFQSMFAISNGTLDDAERFINAARSLNVKHLALARAQYELAKARHAAMRTRGNAG